MRLFAYAGLVPILCAGALAAPEVETVRGPSTALIVTPATIDPSEERDPRSVDRFRAVCYVDVEDGVSNQRRFAVHVPDRDQLHFGRKAGRFMALLWGMANQRFGRSCARLRDGIVHVWLTRSGEPGGEQHNRHLYIYDLFSGRAGIEWARELAHEYGHYLLPGPSGYTSPESWANGVLGERLFLKWLNADVSAERIAPGEVPYVKMADLADYCSKQVTPLIERVEAAGVDAARLSRIDKSAMDSFTGLLLYVDSIHDSSVLMNMLDYLPRDPAGRVRGIDFLDAFETWAGRQTVLNTTIPPTGSMIYLPAGRYRVRGGKEKPAHLAVGRPATVSEDADGWIASVPAPGWRLVKAGTRAEAVSLRWQKLPK